LLLLLCQKIEDLLSVLRLLFLLDRAFDFLLLHGLDGVLGEQRLRLNIVPERLACPDGAE